MTEHKSLQKAVALAGGQTAFARKISDVIGKKVTQAHVWNWLHRDHRIGSEFAIPGERAVEGQVTRHQLRPDLYPQETEVA